MTILELLARLNAIFWFKFYEFSYVVVYFYFFPFLFIIIISKLGDDPTPIPADLKMNIDDFNTEAFTAFYYGRPKPT